MLSYSRRVDYLNDNGNPTSHWEDIPPNTSIHDIAVGTIVAYGFKGLKEEFDKRHADSESRRFKKLSLRDLQILNAKVWLDIDPRSELAE